jgi:hypothetical protein
MQKQVININLSILDEIMNLNRDAGSKRVIQREIGDAFKKLTDSIEMNKKALQKSEQGLKAAQDLGEPKSIETFKRYIKSISEDIKETERTLNAVKAINIGF